MFGFGSTAQPARQIENGAPYDVFAPAEVEHIAELESKGLLARGSRAVCAAGILAAWIPSGRSGCIKRPTHLTQSDAKIIAVANPKPAPYGEAAEQALRTPASGIARRQRLSMRRTSA